MEYLRAMATNTVVDHNRRLSTLIILLASISFLIVLTSITAFIYVTRKGKFDRERQGIMIDILERILRKLHLIVVVIIILVELAFLTAVVTCCVTQSKGQS